MAVRHADDAAAVWCRGVAVRHADSAAAVWGRGVAVRHLLLLMPYGAGVWL